MEKTKGGNVYFNGQDLTKLSNSQMRSLRKDIQLIFQDPDASLNPRMTVKELIQEPWIVNPDILEKKQWDREVIRLMDPSSTVNRHKFTF